MIPCSCRSLGRSADVVLEVGRFKKEQSLPASPQEKTVAWPNVNLEVERIAAQLKRCASRRALSEGKCLHDYIIKYGLMDDRFLRNHLINMYGKCGALRDAREVFDLMKKKNVFTWNIMLSAYVQHRHLEAALHLFQQMPTRNVVSWTTMVVAHSQLGRLEDACLLFECMPKRNVVTWNSMITGYGQKGHLEQALSLFDQMQLEGMKPDKYTLVNLLEICAKNAALVEGQKLSRYISTTGMEFDVVVWSALSNMYAKCGQLKYAQELFNQMPHHDVISWSTMIAAFVQHGHGRKALQNFQQMQLNGSHPNDVTFNSILSACCQDDLVDEGCSHFISMTGDHSIIPLMEHYSSLIHLLGKVGWLEDAESVINSMPLAADAIPWTAFLTSCSSHSGNNDVHRKMYNRMQDEILKQGNDWPT